jgi:hypothetical protein
VSDEIIEAFPVSESSIELIAAIDYYNDLMIRSMLGLRARPYSEFLEKAREPWRAMRGEHGRHHR